MTKLQIGVVCALAVGAIAGFVAERRMVSAINGRLMLSRQEQGAAGTARQKAPVAEAVRTAARTQEVTRLREETALLQAEFAAIVRRRQASATPTAPKTEALFTGVYFERNQVEKPATAV